MKSDLSLLFVIGRSWFFIYGQGSFDISDGLFFVNLFWTVGIWVI